MEFGAKNIFPIQIGGTEIWVSETITNTWIIMLVLIAFAIVARVLLRRFKEVPRGFQNVIEAGVDAFDNVVRSSAGEDLMGIGNWFFMVFIFVLVSNLSGLVGMRPPTADWGTAFALAFATFVIIQIIGVSRRKGKYLKSFFEPSPIFLPLNIIGELARPISLSFRLFGNVLAGLILMSLVYALAPVYIRFIIPSALHAYFDLFSGALQTYIFCVLGMTFIGSAAADEE